MGYNTNMTTQINKVEKIKKYLLKMNKLLEKEDSVLAFIIYGSYSTKSDHQPTELSDVDLEIVVKKHRLWKIFKRV